MKIVSWLTGLFSETAQAPEITFPQEMYTEVISKPGAHILVQCVHLTEAQHKSLCCANSVFIPGYSKPQHD